MPLKDTIIRTSADELVELVKINKKISIEDASKKLKIPVATIQALCDFLVEEKIFGIEYKFTTPYIYLYNESIKAAKTKSDKGLPSGLITKDQFYERAQVKKVPFENVEGLWRKYLRQNLVRIREEFVAKAKEKKIPDEKIEDLWSKYLTYI